MPVPLLIGVTGFVLFQVYSAGFSAPTPIQAQSWPIALQSRDIVAVAKTGSGKTLGYLIPGFLHLKRCRNDPKLGPTVLVLSPTRELATQIQDEAVKFGKSSRLACTVHYILLQLDLNIYHVYIFSDIGIDIADVILSF
jgi:ATP-dependent RNA helicase DDX5/DBP2